MGSRWNEPTRDAGWRLSLVSFGLALAASLILLLAPLGSSIEPVPADGRLSTVRQTHHSLLQHEGWSVAIPLAVPVGISAVALIAGRGTWRRPARVVGAVLLLAFVVVGIFSIGIFYLPAAATILGAAATAVPSKAVR